MKSLLHKIGAAVILSSTFFFAGCDPEFEDDRTLSAGSLDLTKYVAVGNSLTAGYQDNGLYLEGQLLSYPNILANQFSYVGGGAFIQPLFTEEQKNGSGYLKLTGFGPSGLPTTAPVTNNLAIRGMGADNKTPLYTKFTGEVQNLGVPGIKMTDVTRAGYGYNNPLGFNPFYERLLSDQVSPTGALLPYVNKVEAVKGTFFTMWLGNNDVLGYATSGGLLAISTDADFQAALDAMVAKLPNQGVIINIPDVTSVPFFTTKATTAIMAQAQAANAKLYITAGNGTTREAKAADYVLLTSTVGNPESVTLPNGATQQIPHGFSPFNPLKNQEVLDETEVNAVKTATTSFNGKLRAAATTKKVAYADMNMYFNTFKAGLSLNGVNYSPAFITGNLFSLDGVHLTPRGYAIVANELIRTINNYYQASIPTIDVTQFRAVLIP